MIHRRITFGLQSVALVLVLAGAVSGCAGISVQPGQHLGLLAAWKASTSNADEVSPRTLQTLRRWDLDTLYYQSPTDAAVRLHVVAVQDSQPDLLFALAEINYLLGRRYEKNTGSEACIYYYLCAGYAYHYLFDNHPECRREAGAPDGVNPFDPRFRLACDLYNTALAKCIRVAQRSGRLDPSQQLKIDTTGGKGFLLSVKHHGFAWTPEEFGPLLFSSDYAVVGLANHYRSYGLGVPLIGTRVATSKSGQGMYPQNVSFPVTAFFRFEGTLADLGACQSGALELYNPLTIQTLAVRDRAVPLESDLTTPLAYFLAHSDLADIWYTGFLHGDDIRKQSGIYLVEPYQPGKIPVVLVHGLLSSPLTWAPMFNDLRADPVLRERFQFWFYLYPTGDPYFSTAANLRHSLLQMRQQLDPEHRDAALDHMVFVGHSMGGLVSKLMTVDSSNDFWSLVSPVPFANLKGPPSALNELEQIFFFAQQPYVERVIFIGTPHHGSKLSPTPVARFIERYVNVPREVMAAVKDIVQENPQAKINLSPDHLPSSVDLLAPGASGLELLAYKPRPPAVHFHSIIGDAPSSSTLLKVGHFLGEDAQRSDGIVPYSSAHLDGVDSELVVAADHTHVHQHPLSVLEVRRILLQHLQDTHP